MSARSYLSIGQVLDLLKQEFPDLTISKIRFLESQGLLDPERTPSGYRKFYEPDVERLRFILRAQQDQYLPLKVIKGRLGDDESSGDTGDVDIHDGDLGAGMSAVDGGNGATGGNGVSVGGPAAGAGGAGGGGGGGGGGAGGGGAGAGGAGAAAAGRPGRPTIAAAPVAAITSSRGAGAPTGGAVQIPATTDPALLASARDRRDEADLGASRHPSMTSPPPPLRAVSEDGAESLTLEELATVSGLSTTELSELERFGLLMGRRIAGTTYYDADCATIAAIAARFRTFGVEARHLRMYRTAVEREAGFFEQVVTPMLKQRNPQARRQAVDALLEMSRLGSAMREAVLRLALREHTGGAQ